MFSLKKDKTPNYVKRAAKILADHYLSNKNEQFFNIDMGIIFHGVKKHIHIVVEEIKAKNCDECFYNEMQLCSGDKCSEVLPVIDEMPAKTICDECLGDPKTCTIKEKCEELRKNAD